MSHTLKNGSLLKMGHTWKMCHTEIWVTLGKMGHTLKNGSHIEKCVTFGKMGHTLKNGPQLKKWVTV